MAQIEGPKPKPNLAASESKDEEYLVHIVESTDTVTFLAVKYGVSEAKIRRSNRGIVPNVQYLDNLKTVRIPLKDVTKNLAETEEEKARRKKYLAKKTFLAKASIEGPIKEDEADYYLFDAEYDVDKAFRMYKADLLWAKTHPNEPMQRESKKPPSESVELKEPLLKEVGKSSSPIQAVEMKAIPSKSDVQPSAPSLPDMPMF